MQISVKKVLLDKNPRLARFLPAFLTNYLKRVVHEDELNDFFKKYGELKDIELVKAGLAYMGINYKVHNKHNIPTSGRQIFVSNHPLGGLDGLVFILELSKYFRDIKFPVNDILLNIGNMDRIFLPVNKHGAQAREAALAIDKAYASDTQILYFPAGLCSRKRKGEIKDLTWHKSFITKSLKHERDVVPVFFSGRNSNFFYKLSNFRKSIGLKVNIEMLYLADEMFKQKDKELNIVFGEKIPWATFDKSRTPVEWAKMVRERSYELENDII